MFHDELADLSVQPLDLDLALVVSSAVAAAALKGASSAIFAFSPASIFRLVLVVMLRSVCRDGTAPIPISQPVPNPGATSGRRESPHWSSPILSEFTESLRSFALG